MHKTIFDNSFICFLLQMISRITLSVLGWNVVGQLPLNAKKSVLVAAPHKTWKDLPFMLMIAFVLRLRVYWMGKDSLFRFPFRSILIFLGGIPITRGYKEGKVHFYKEVLRKSNLPIQLVIAPEGTRKEVAFKDWKKGFYYIAQDAGVPIVLAFIDYKNKRGGLGKTLIPSGGIENDMKIIERFYQPFLTTKET